MPIDFLNEVNCGDLVDELEEMADESEEPDEALKVQISLTQVHLLAVIASSLQRIASSLETITMEGIPNGN